jgi:hypothetical protein
MRTDNGQAGTSARRDKDMHRTVGLAITAAACALGTGAAQADRPLATDTAGVKGRQVCQLSAFAGRERARGAPHTGFRVVEAGCGIGFDTELWAGVERATSGGERADALSVGGKTDLVAFAGEAGGIAFAYGTGWDRPRGGPSEHAASNITLIASRRIGDVTLHANLGHERDHAAHRGATVMALAGEWAFAPRWTWSTELFGDDRSRPWAATSLYRELDEAVGVYASVAVQRGGARPRQWSAGINWNF